MFDPARLVFIDETSTSTNMVRLRGRCRRGERSIGRAPQGHWKTVTFVAGRDRERSEDLDDRSTPPLSHAVFADSVK